MKLKEGILQHLGIHWSEAELQLYTCHFHNYMHVACKEMWSDSLGLVDFAIGSVNSVFNLPNRQVKFFGVFKLQKNCNQSCSSWCMLATACPNGKL